MICVYDEQETVKLAIESTQGFADFYVVVDKNGETIPAIENYAESHGLDVEYHVKPELTLAESRDYALTKLTRAEWVLLLDGDEVYDHHLKTMFQTPPHPQTYYRTRKNIIYPDHTMPLYQQGYHNFLLHNNGTIRIPYPNDIPRMTGRAIHLPEIMIWNYHKNKRPEPQTVHYNPTLHGKLPTILEAEMGYEDDLGKDKPSHI